MSGPTLQCSSCAFSQLAVMDDGPALECRRYPPSMLLVEGKPVRMAQQVDGDEWCGEWSASVGESTALTGESDDEK